MTNMKRIVSFWLCLSLIVMLFSSCATLDELGPVEVTSENASTVLEGFVQSIAPSVSSLKEGVIPEATDNGKNENGFIFEMPDINNYELSVKGKGELDVEIFLPIENNGSSILELISHVANGFNEKGYVIDGKKISVSLRALEATLAEEYILKGMYVPKGYIATNELYGLLMKENGIDVSLVSEKTVGNTMGIVIEKSKYDELTEKYGEVTVQTIVKASEAGEIAIGYPNPTNNPTGLNFVISMLAYFDAGNPMSFEATADFSRFQSSVSQVSFDTNQLKTGVEKGVLDAFVMEYQAFSKDESLSGFQFMSFGVRHDNPMYAVGEVSQNEFNVLKIFSTYLTSMENVVYGESLGFNQNETYQSNVTMPDGDFIMSVLDLWKEQRNAAGNISVIFVADVSGSMDGEKIEKLKSSLLSAMQYIGEKTRVGLVSFNSFVHIDLELAPFDEQQRKYFVGAVESWEANSGTATNNGLVVAQDMLVKDKQEHPDSRQLIILLSDGQTGNGFSFSYVKNVIGYYGVPIYTIGYGSNADEDELTRISDLNNGTFIKADDDDISYIMKTLFNAEA